MRTALYARYSDDRQNERSIADQLELCRRHAAARGWTVVAEFFDAAISGAAMANRPGLQALLTSADAGAFDQVLVEDTDRLARNREHDAHVFNRLAYAGVTIATPNTDKVTVIESALKGLMNELYLVQLGEKTRRGMTSNAEKGLATGSRLYGYATAPGGATTIVEMEAQVIRRICTLFAVERLTPRQIADRLNREHVPSPRGGVWNASSINGSRQRGNGILQTELYSGVKVWNRMEVRKDPQTGRRLPRMRPESEWRRTPVPELAILPADLWASVCERKAAESGQSPPTLAYRRRPGIFSGLFKCHYCGSTYTAYGRGRLICAGHREKGASYCANRRTVNREEVEVRVLEGLRTRLLTPAAVAAYVRLYHAAWTRQEAERSDRRAPMERRHAELSRSIERIVDAICDGTATDAMKARLVAMEREKADLAAQLAQDAPPAPTTLHPKAADAFAAQVARLRDRLTAVELGEDRKLLDAVRGLVEQITIAPKGDHYGGPVDITLHGRLALFLEPPATAAQTENRSGGVLVAGGGYIHSPTAVPGFVFRLAG